MLLIAIPKSASTSLAFTLAKFAGAETASAKVLGRKKKFPKAKGFEFNHSDARDYDRDALVSMCGSDHLYKVHLPPSENNLKIISELEHNIVILLRDPDEATEAKTRHVQGKEGKQVNEIAGGKYEETLDNMRRFYDGWMSLKGKNNILIVDFEELVTDLDVVKKIVDHYGIDYSGNVKLYKRKYTGVGIAKIEGKNNVSK